MSNQTPFASPTVPGSILAGKYRVERIIGQGGMGVVVEARHITLDERVALKFLLPEYATHPEAAARFLREAKAAVKIKSEHVARVSDVGTLETGAPYMVMEFLEGSDLSHLIEKSGVLGVADAVDYIIQGCDALAEAHAHGIVHRDIKPANLFLTKRPNGTPQVKVLDFGISKVMGGQVDSLTKTTASMGSALYMSPEQMQTTRGVDHRTDIYALGISLYELLAGKQPFYADTLPQLCAEIFTGTPTPIRSLRSDVPDGLAAVLEKAYARDRAFRYQSVGELVIALAPYAPPRSQVAIESVAKIAGLQTPFDPQAAGRASAPQVVPAYAPLMPYGAPPTARSAGVVPVVGGVPHATGPGISVITASSIPTSSRGPFVALALVAVVAMGGAGAFFAWRPRASHPASSNTASTLSTLPTAATAIAAPVPTPPVETAPSATAPAAPAGDGSSVVKPLANAPNSGVKVAPIPTGPLNVPTRPGAQSQSRPPAAKPAPGSSKPTDVGF